MSKTTLKKHQRQLRQQERQQEKALRRAERKLEKPHHSRSMGQEDPDLKGMVPGPQHLRREEAP